MFKIGDRVKDYLHLCPDGTIIKIVACAQRGDHNVYIINADDNHVLTYSRHESEIEEVKKAKATDPWIIVKGMGGPELWIVSTEQASEMNDAELGCFIRKQIEGWK